MITESELMQKLEPLVDEAGLQMVIDTLVTMCSQKADHIESNWQKCTMANTWRRAGRNLAEFMATTKATPIHLVS